MQALLLSSLADIVDIQPTHCQSWVLFMYSDSYAVWLLGLLEFVECSTAFFKAKNHSIHQSLLHFRLLFSARNCYSVHSSCISFFRCFCAYIHPNRLNHQRASYAKVHIMQPAIKGAVPLEHNETLSI